MIEKKIYPSFAFTENEQEKAKMNAEIYREFIEKFKVYRNDTKIDLADGVDCDFSEYDIVIGRKPGYNHALYKVYKNNPLLNTTALALICDHGSLCFGFTMQGDKIYVFED